jgi:hypothetical protein
MQQVPNNGQAFNQKAIVRPPANPYCFDLDLHEHAHLPQCRRPVLDALTVDPSRFMCCEPGAVTPLNIVVHFLAFQSVRL